MFTGIIEETGSVQTIRATGRSSRITLAASEILRDLKIGDSINTNGVCLTVTAFSENSFTVDVMPETMKRTAFRELKTGSRVNLERALRLIDRLGGHIVTGHIDGTGTIKAIRKDENSIVLTIAASENILRYVVEKGSIAVDGISLTVSSVNKLTFEVSIIPHTLTRTTIHEKRTGAMVNLECDVIGKYVEKLQDREKGTFNWDSLKEGGSF